MKPNYKTIPAVPTATATERLFATKGLSITPHQVKGVQFASSALVFCMLGDNEYRTATRTDKMETPDDKRDLYRWAAHTLFAHCIISIPEYKQCVDVDFPMPEERNRK